MPPKALVKYFGPTMGKTTAKNSQLIDFDDIMSPIKDALAKEYGITRTELVTKGHPALQRAYAEQIDLWRNDPANAGKTLMVSSAGTLDPKFGIQWDNVPSLPSREAFIQRSVNRGDTASNAADWYDNLCKRYPFVIDDRFISEMPELWPTWNVGEKFTPAEMYHKNITIPMAIEAGIFDKEAFDSNLKDFQFDDLTHMYDPDVWGRYISGSNTVKVFKNPHNLQTGVHELRHWLDASKDEHITTRIPNIYQLEDASVKLEKDPINFLKKLNPRYFRRPIQLTDSMVDLLGKTYVPSSGKASKLLSEKIATNSEGRFTLFKNFYDLNKRWPTLSEFQQYIKEISDEELIKTIKDLHSSYSASYAPQLKGKNIRKSYLTVPAMLPFTIPLILNNSSKKEDVQSNKMVK